MLQTLEYKSLIAHMSPYFWVQIVMVLICAGIIGFERQVSKKPSGIRTSILITLGSFLFVKYAVMTLGAYQGPGGDPTRVIGQVVTGIGFLGAGTIMNREGLVVGLTTAATIWVQSAIGILIALGYLVDAFIFSLVTLITLQLVTKLEAYIRILRHRTRGPVKKKAEDV